MNRRPPLNFDMSVSADKKKRRAKRKSTTGAFEASGRQCYHKGCELEGKYRAPKSPDLIDEFNWFCVKHVREYNSKWNFFENHSSEELEEHIKDDAVWSRKTSPINQDNKVHTEGRSWARMGFDDPHEILGSKGTKDPSEHVTSVSQKRLPPSERKALEILDARDTMSKEQIRKIYKALVKDLHPDMNGGRRDDEDRLTEVVWAWDQIKTSRSFKE
jgi:hypothetical protein